MPVVTYETLFLLDPNKIASDAEAAKTTLHTLIERVGGHVEVSRPWDYNHKLTYPIHKSKKGAFHIIYYTLESLKQADLEREFKLNPDLIYRHMTLHVDPKWLEIVMGVARDDHGMGFAVRGMHEEGSSSDPSALTGIPEVDGDMAGMGGPPRRGGRRFDSEKPE